MIVRKPLTIQVNVAQLDMLDKLCKIHGLPGVPRACMASTAFARGLGILKDEILGK